MYIYSTCVSIFTGSPRRSVSTHAPAREMSGSHTGSRCVHVGGEDDIAGVGGEVTHDKGTLNAYIFFF